MMSEDVFTCNATRMWVGIRRKNNMGKELISK